jgi:hypothetical protein
MNVPFFSLFLPFFPFGFDEGLAQVDAGHVAPVGRGQEPRRSAEAAADVEQAGTPIDAESLRKLPRGAELASPIFPTLGIFLRRWGIIGWNTRYIK